MQKSQPQKPQRPARKQLRQPSLDRYCIQMGEVVSALNLLADLEPFATLTEYRRNIVEIIDNVACKPGNTRAVCRKYYIHPRVLETYESGRLTPWLEKVQAARKAATPPDAGLHADEKVLLQFLSKEAALCFL
ncbi:MAG TPA: hypothetical protein VM802_25975 [Chitinophaga sp.]|uniref:hypothetical protein n=1 Tax=Chitinophaga sp. TaxID=1869181 RepID=UPI002BE42777|nr:hypothetical protein [Chitinophaga sp.]HVI48344.1 hypothetical protein [Chitinophaga sp.]